MQISRRPKAEVLTAAQEKLWSDTRVALLWEAPAFSHIFYTMLNTVGSKYIAMFTKEVPIAATDGAALLLNPDTFFNFNLKKRVFICGHEIMHCIFNHCGMINQLARRGKVAYPDGKELEYKDPIMQKALDLVINDGLIQSKFGEFDPTWLHDPTIVTSADSGLEAYRKIYEDEKSKGGKGKPGPGQSPSGRNGNSFDQHLAPGASQGQDPITSQQQRNEAEWQTQIQAAATAAKLQGKLPAGIERMLEEVLNPTVDWKEKIKSLFARKVGSGTYDWRKPDRRLITRDIYSPGRSGFGAGDVVVGVDTSGSIDEPTLRVFFSELAGILEDVNPKRLFIVWCDAEVGRVDEVSDIADLYDVRKQGAPGGGGTSFIPVFNWLADSQIEPDALVYLTDGYGSFPDFVPTYPMIWGSITPNYKYPFGDVVEIPVQAS